MPWLIGKKQVRVGKLQNIPIVAYNVNQIPVHRNHPAHGLETRMTSRGGSDNRLAKLHISTSYLNRAHFSHTTGSDLHKDERLPRNNNSIEEYSDSC